MMESSCWYAVMLYSSFNLYQTCMRGRQLTRLSTVHDSEFCTKTRVKMNEEGQGVEQITSWSIPMQKGRNC